jgi:class 3 adenylate cyclase/tetratricopeptide (TPR) repeat protein
MVRKTVTVFFADLVGSTALGERTDPEVLQELMARYHAELRHILERHGGTVEKFVGDAAMAVFGIPEVHEDDALRAIRAAVEIREATAARGLEVRIGVNTGEVVAAEGETLVTGDPVNVAARLEQSAAAGEVLLGERTYALVRDAVLAESVEPLTVKGKREPLTAYRLVETLVDAPAFTRAIDAPFVGRKRELEMLEAAFADAVDRRECRLATIIGPPGIGKSRLARELVQHSDARVLVGRCLSYGEGITYWPLAEILRQLGDVTSAVDDGLVVQRVLASTDASDATADEIAWGFRRLFEELARERPMIVVLDDIQWAEPTLLDLVEYVATFTQDSPLLLLCMARADLFELRAAWATPKPNATLVTLDPLPDEETLTLVEQLRIVPDDVKARIVDAAEGNPLFVEQLVAMQADNGGGDFEIPPTIQALLAARIDRLESEERAVIERASIEGRMFHRGSVAELVPDDARPRVGAHLLTLVRKDFIRPDRATIAGDDGFRFGHILIRDAAYDSIPKRLRAELHVRFADWLEARVGEDAPDEILGHHLEQAYRYRVELGPDDEHARALAQRAGGVLSQAGRRAQARLDITAAESLLGRAIELLPDDAPERPSLLVELGKATYFGGDLARAREILDQATRAAAAAGQRNIEIQARMRELVALSSGGSIDSSDALAEARAAVAELQQLEDPEALLDAWWLIGWLANMRGDTSLRAQAAAARLDLAKRVGSRSDGADAARTLAFTLGADWTPIDEAIERTERALADFPEEPEVELALLYAYAGRHNDAERAMERGRRAQLELGHRLQHAADSMDYGWVALLAGEPERAEQELRDGAAFLEAAGEKGWLSTVAAVLAEVLYRLDRDDEAEEWTRRSEEVTAGDDVVSQAMWRSIRAKVLAGRGESEEASRLSAEAVEWARTADMASLLGDCLSDRGEVLLMLGRPEEGRPLLEEALGVYERKGIVPSIERTRALLARTGS